jgi:hypothetical protein
MGSADDYAQPSRPIFSASSTGLSADQRPSRPSKWHASDEKKRGESGPWSQTHGKRRRSRCSSTLDGRTEHVHDKSTKHHGRNGK